MRAPVPDEGEVAEAQHHVRPTHQEPARVEEQEGQGAWQGPAAGSRPDLPVQGQGEGEAEEVWERGAASREQVQGQVHGRHG